MGRRALGLGENGEVVAKPQRRVDGRWRNVDKVRHAERWRARTLYRGHDGVVVDVTRIGRTRREAERAIDAALTELRRDGDEMLTAASTLATAGEVWFTQISRIEAGMAAATLRDYRRALDVHILGDGSTVRGLTLAQLNDAQRLRGFLQGVADRRGTGAAKHSRAVLGGLLGYAVDSGILPGSALRQVRAVKAAKAHESRRDLRRAFTREQRDAVIAYADKIANDEDAGLNPRTRRKREATADFVAWLAGTGVRIAEARAQLWEDVDLDTGRVRVRGTKTGHADRTVTLPPWLAARMRDRAERVGTDGLVFSSPGTSDPERPWEQKNNADAVRRVLDGSGHEWAVPHSFRRTVATLLHEAGVPIARIADQLGHADPAMTASVYLGRDFDGEKTDIAAHL